MVLKLFISTPISARAVQYDPTRRASATPVGVGLRSACTGLRAGFKSRVRGRGARSEREWIPARRSGCNPCESRDPLPRSPWARSPQASKPPDNAQRASTAPPLLKPALRGAGRPPCATVVALPPERGEDDGVREGTRVTGPLDFRVLGPLEAVGENGPLPLPKGNVRAVLAVLLMHANEVVATDRLIEDVWGDEPSGERDEEHPRLRLAAPPDPRRRRDRDATTGICAARAGRATRPPSLRAAARGSSQGRSTHRRGQAA